MSQDGGEADVESTLNTWRLVAIGKAEPPTGSFIGNAFPSDAVRDAYLSRIDQWPEEEVRAVLRNMLGHSRDLAVYDELQLAILKRSRGEAAAAGSVAAAAAVASTSDQAAIRPAFSEYERRLILAAAKKTSVPVWEGLTWVLDLLPYAPSEALSTVSAYITAHFGVVPDVRLNALLSVMSLTATSSTSGCFSMARNVLRPMRPSPLMPIRIATVKSSSLSVQGSMKVPSP